MTRRNTGFPTAVKDMVYTRAGGCCEVCGQRTSDLQYHHRRARGMGGTLREDTNYASNCLLVCRGCHSNIESHRWLAQGKGLLLKQCQVPSQVPVSLRGVWWLLDDEGGKTPAEQAA